MMSYCRLVFACHRSKRKSEFCITRNLPNPWFKILNEQARLMNAIAPKLFLTPSDRHMLLGADERPSKFDGLLGPKPSPDYLS